MSASGGQPNKGLVALWTPLMWERLKEVEASLKWIVGPRDVTCGSEEFVVLCNVRNSELWIKSFLEHYDRLGVKHYFFFDNGSTDETLRILSGKQNATLVQSLLPFDRYYSDFYRYMLWNFGRTKWALYVDQDHLFDYPGSSSVKMDRLLNYLNHREFNAVRTHIIDMFSDEPLARLDSRPGDDLRTKYPLCDLSDLWAIPDPYGERNSGPGRDIPYLTGGIRKSMFGTDWIYLTCHSLLFDGAEILHPNGHSVVGARIADFSAMIWHFKFLSHFYSIADDFLGRWTADIDSRCTQAIFEEQQAYVRTLKHNPLLNLASRKPFKPRSSDDLLRAGVLQVSDQYMRFWKSFGATESTEVSLR
jgi:hypothetical protein